MNEKLFLKHDAKRSINQVFRSFYRQQVGVFVNKLRTKSN